MRVRRLYGSTRHCALAQISLGDSTTGPAQADQEIAIAPLLGCLRARGAADRPRGGTFSHYRATITASPFAQSSRRRTGVDRGRALLRMAAQPLPRIFCSRHICSAQSRGGLMARSFTFVPPSWRWIASRSRRWAVVPVVRIVVADLNVNPTVERNPSKYTLFLARSAQVRLVSGPTDRRKTGWRERKTAEMGISVWVPKPNAPRGRPPGLGLSEGRAESGEGLPLETGALEHSDRAITTVTTITGGGSCDGRDGGDGCSSMLRSGEGGAASSRAVEISRRVPGHRLFPALCKSRIYSREVSRPQTVEPQDGTSSTGDAHG
jgi:hypothetical protein